MSLPTPLRWLLFPSRYHFWLSLLIVVFSLTVISTQILDRHATSFQFELIISPSSVGEEIYPS